MVIVIFDEDLRVAEAMRVPRATVETLFEPRPKDGARSRTLLAHPSLR